MKFELSKIADTLVSQSGLFNCSLEEAWKNCMHPLLTNAYSFQEVKEYIDRKVELGTEMNG